MVTLPIFPRSGFDQSVTTPVLLGVLVSWGFTETFGWVFAGLVVPGYLAAVCLLEPAAGFIDIFEAILTYLVARAIGEHLPRFGVTSRVFGRERFFLVVVVSILVRLAVEGWLLPRVVPHATWAYSIGLVLVPLAANACWKTGLLRGLVQNGVPTLIVYLMLRWIFVPHTNLSLAGFALATENLSAGFLTSPKAYIVLVTAAMIAAAANVRYGWDFSGILVPALLALAVTEPVKFAATFAETIILYLVVTGLLAVTPLKRLNLEGARKTVLFFTVDYALRFTWAGVMGTSLPGGDIVSLMGFGYLLPTLLAVKISQRGAPLVLLPTLSVSVVGLVVGTVVGFGAHLVDRAAIAAPPPNVVRTMPRPPSSPAAAALWVGQLAVNGLVEPDANVTGDLSQTRRFLEAMTRGDPAAASAANVEVTAVDEGVFVVRERFGPPISRRGVPAYLLRSPLPEHPVVALVPTPLASPSTAALAGLLLAARDVDAVVVTGIEEPKKGWLELETTAHAAARWLARDGTLVTVRDKADPRVERGPGGERALAKLDSRERVNSATKRAAGTTIATARGDLVLAIDPVGVAVALAPRRSPIALDNATDMAAAIADIRAAANPGDLEHLVALRRLVLEPLLAPGASEAARALAPFAAEALGYRITAPSPWPSGGEGVALLPVQRGLPIVVFARTTAARARVVEAPFGSHQGVRDLTVRFAVALGADAIILGQGFDGAMRGGAVRAAHGAATSEQAPTVFVVKEDPMGSGVKLAAWMDDGSAIGASRQALDALGILAVDAPPDLALRALATRTLLRPTAVIALSAGASTLQLVSLDVTRRAHERLTDLPVRDGTLAAAAGALAGALDESRAPAIDEVDDVVRRASGDASIAAAHRLSAQLAKTAVRAAIVSAKADGFVVAVARTPRRRMVIVSPLSGSAEWRTERRASFAACYDAPVVPGVCESPER